MCRLISRVAKSILPPLEETRLYPKDALLCAIVRAQRNRVPRECTKCL
jgi:hypothetical protein